MARSDSFFQNEAARLATLADHELSKRDDDPVLDGLARTAARLARTQTGLVTLITRTRQVVKARAGTHLRGTAREHAFCPHAMASGDVLEVPDATADPRFRDNPLVTGEPRIRFYAGVPLVSEEGHPLGTLCVLDDVPGTLNDEQRAGLRDLARAAARILADRRRVLHRSREREAERAFNAHVIAQTPLLIAGVEPDGTTAFVNPAVERATGYSAGDLIGAPWWTTVHGDAHHAETRALNDHFTQRGDVSDRELAVVDRGGDTHRVRWTSLNRWDTGGRLRRIVLVGRDMTEERRQQLVREEQQRLEALGQMAGGLAHELNNALQPVLGLSDVAVHSAVAREDVDRSLAMIRAYAEHARDLVAQVLAFARGGDTEVVNVDAATALTEAVAFAAELVPRSVNIACSGFGATLPDQLPIAPAVMHVPADPDGDIRVRVAVNSGQLAQVMSNLVINAVDAMDGGGTLRISLSRRTVGPDDTAPGDLPAGSYAAVTVADSGHGMTDATRRRALQPFYTTKATGGTGLGLAVVRGILRSWGGTLAIASEPSQGTTVTLYVPVRDTGEPEQPTNATGFSQ